MNRISHIGIAVQNIGISAKLFERLLGTPPGKAETVGSQKVEMVFFDIGGVRIELTQPTSDESPVRKFLERRGEGVHHIAFEVEDITAELTRLRREGFEIVEQAGTSGSQGSKVAFIHPKSANGVLVEVTQSAKK